MQQHTVVSGKLTLNYKMNGAGSFNLFEISGTRAGEYLKNTGGEREPRKSLKGRVKSKEFVFPYSPRETQWWHCQKQEAEAPFLPWSRELHCNPTTCTLLGQGGRWGGGGRGCSLLREGSSEAKPQSSASPWANNLLTCSIPVQHALFQASLHTFPSTNPWLCTRSSLAQLPALPHLPHTSTSQHPRSGAQKTRGRASTQMELHEDIS